MNSMKSLFVFIALFTLLNHINAQDTTKSIKPKANIEIAATKTGLILKKEVNVINEIRNLEVCNLIITTSDSIEKGVYLRGNTSSWTGQTKFYSGYLDSDEVKDFIIFLKLVKNVLSTPEPENEVEYSFNSRGNVQGYIYNTKGAYGNNWHYGLDLDRIFTGGTFEFKEKDIDKIIDAFEVAKLKL